MTKQRLKTLSALNRRRIRREEGVFLVEGVRSVESAIDAGAPLIEILVGERADEDDRIAAIVASSPVPVERIPSDHLDRIADAQTCQGIVAVARSVVTDTVEPEGPMLLLDGVQDPGNVGALIRTAAWFGIRTVVGDEKTADPESPKVVRASMGGLWDVRLARVSSSLLPVLEALAEADVEAWGAHLGGTAVGEWSPAPTAALVMGSEAHGLTPSVAEWLRSRPNLGFVGIPGGGGGGVESLNVAVAGGILMQRWLG